MLGVARLSTSGRVVARVRRRTTRTSRRRTHALFARFASLRMQHGHLRRQPRAHRLAPREDKARHPHLAAQVRRSPNVCCPMWSISEKSGDVIQRRRLARRFADSLRLDRAAAQRRSDLRWSVHLGRLTMAPCPACRPSRSVATSDRRQHRYDGKQDDNQAMRWACSSMLEVMRRLRGERGQADPSRRGRRTNQCGRDTTIDSAV